MSFQDSAHLAIRIRRSADEVYDYVSNPENLPEWAAGLGGSVEQRDGVWWAESPMGEVQVSFVEANAFRVADHTVTLPDGQRVLNPMRVLEHAEGCEVVFSLFRRPEMSSADFERDGQTVEADLARLKSLLEF
ncbi:MAG: SRPBCC family protein [Candidatus Eremiobacteraeota bacterium]|nr:SRPBCC family protein [Candidatus Eremiobacteraeota bacterium]